MTGGELLQYQADTVLSLTRGGMRKGEINVMVARGAGKSGSGTTVFGSSIRWPALNKLNNKCRSTTELWMFKERFQEGNVTLVKSEPDKHIRKYKDDAGGYFSVHYDLEPGTFHIEVTGVRQWNDYEIKQFES